MNVRFHFKQMKSSPSLENYAADKVQERLQRLCRGNSWVHFSFAIEDRFPAVHCELFSGNGLRFHSQATDPNFFSALDQAIENVAVKLQRKKERITDHRDRTSVRFDGQLFSVPAVASITAAEVVRGERDRLRMQAMVHETPNTQLAHA